MNIKLLLPTGILLTVGSVAAFAALHENTPQGSAQIAALPPQPGPADFAGEGSEPPLPANHPAIGGKRGSAQALPPNHPPVGGAGGPSPHGGAAAAPHAAAAEAASLAWTAPSTWPSMPNPNAMRLETHKVPRAAGDSEDAELSVSRAGGDTDANIKRWVGQFEDAANEQRHERTVHGVKVTIVEVEGTYGGGMGPQADAKKGWALLAAIAEGPGRPYFFKMTGPAATVHGARASFDAMLDAVAPL